eukprot:1159009-Pelagomonas_calceolata.AAC.1
MGHATSTALLYWATAAALAAGATYSTALRFPGFPCCVGAGAAAARRGAACCPVADPVRGPACKPPMAWITNAKEGLAKYTCNCAC